MCRLILTAGLCLIIASLARTTSASCANGCATGFCSGRTDGNYINPANPNSYYECSNQLTYLMNCTSGLVYRATCNCCDNPNNPCPATTTAGPTTPTTTPNNFCQGKADGYYCNPQDNTKFYRCVSGVTYSFMCPSGQVFSSSANTCVPPQNVGK